VAYRAGGYGVQPGAEDILKALIDTGYVFDSSVVPGLVSKSRILQTDFSAAPAAFNYFVSPESGFFKPAGSGIFEIPIAASRIGRYFTVKNFISRKLGEAQGAGVRREGMTVTQSLGCERVRMGPAERVKNYFSKLVWPGGGWAMLDLCSDPQSMYYLTKRYLRNVRPEDKDVYFAMSCHSKDVTGEKLDALAAYWKLLKNHYGAGIGALSFMEAARKVT
jgi:hypothetical protein